MQHRKALFLGVLALGLVPAGLHAQESVLSAGGDATGNGSFSYSVGQVFYETYFGTDASLAQGVQQAYEISSTIGITEYDAITLESEIYPNPTKDFLTLDVKDFPFDELDYILYDVTGRALISREIDQSKTIIDMISFPEATYFLKVSDGKSIMKTFKIIKN
jgi:hypothetical protein